MDPWFIELTKDGRRRGYSVTKTNNLINVVKRSVADGWEVTPDTSDAFKRAFNEMSTPTPNRARGQAFQKPSKLRQFVKNTARQPELCGVWYAIPTANAELANRCFAAWRTMGYKTAAFDDNGLDLDCDHVVDGEYLGYADAVNTLSHVLADRAEIIVTGGDDIYPDPDKTADEIAAEFHERFPDGFGVMQPTGDKHGNPERICGSPWMGMEFIRRMNGGKGPFWPEYLHFFCDEEMHDVAEHMGILWQRKDLTHYHDCYRRNGTEEGWYNKRAHRNWGDAKKLFTARKAAGFPGHEPCD